jgi:FAD/FMN-containing dehydrogenase
MTNIQPRFESWGRYPVLEADLLPLHWAADFPPKSLPATAMLPVGAGRSYGDVCLLDRGTLLATRGLDRLLHFDAETGSLCCEAGVTLAEILEFAVPRGFFLSVTPGTKYVTLGGAIANDIHGKNHHIVGTFGSHVVQFELIRSDGTRLQCSPTENAEWFSATIGGMGLTGLITRAEIRLRRIVSRKIRYQGTKFVGVDEFVALSQASTDVEYTVAWIDCVARGRNFARGIFMQGDHSDRPEPMASSKAPKLKFPVNLPELALNRLSVGVFNALYYNKQFGKRKSNLLDYEPFFYPLDSVLQWNRIYGKSGLLQFQCVIPWEQGSQTGLVRILEAITASGLASFLAVMKVFGDKPSPGMLSFPKPGITLSLDFPIRHEVSFALCDRLANIVMEHGGRMYPAKDARMTAKQFQAFYPDWLHFAKYVDPSFSSALWQRVTTLG